MLGKDLLPVLSGKHEILGKDIQDFDITDQKRAQEEIAVCHPEVVINAAAYTDVDGCETQRDLAYAVNAEGALNIAKACTKAGCQMLHLSTDYVFDGTSSSPYPEEATPNPLNIYGKSKHQAEIYIREILKNHLIIRTEWLYGSHGRNFVDTILRLAARQNELRVVNDQRGSPTFTKDLSWAIERVLEKRTQGTLNVTNSGSCTWFEFAQKILELKNLPGCEIRLIPISSAELARPAKRPAYSVLDCSRFEQIAGTRMRSWEEGVKEYLSA